MTIETGYYLDKFKNSAGRLDQNLLRQTQIEYKTGVLNYNIHALKLRQLTGYSIKSRDFAEAFRSRFKPFENKWPNVSVDFGPLTLMQGWVSIDIENPENEIAGLAHQFLEIQFIIDELLKERKK